MSDYLDIVKSALDKGIILDSCGSDERQKWWGLYNDLCGMSVEDAMAVQYYHGGGGGEDEKKKKNTITFAMQMDGSEYSLFLTAANAPTSDMLVSFSMDGEQKIVTFPAGVKSFNTGFKAPNGYKYATISNINVAGDDEKYTYTTENTVKDGYFKLTIVNDGVQTVESIFYNSPVDLPTKTKVGYNFVWRNSDGEVIENFNMPEKDTKIVGAFEAKEYTITYTIYEEYAEDESNEALPKKEYKNGELTVKYDSKLLPVLNSLMPNRTGYSNSKWADNTGTEISSSSTMNEEITSVSATYKLNKYTLACYVDDVLWNSQEKYFGTEIDTVEEPSKTGYQFDKWSIEIPSTMPANNIITHAIFEAIPYYIIYNVDGVEKYKEEHIYGDPIEIRADEEKIGYTFSGWDTVLPDTMPNENIIINGTFTINSYTIAYKVDGIEYSAETYEYGASVTPLEEPEKEGYTFSGWKEPIPAIMPAKDLTINGEFAINYYKVRYYISGETALVGEQEYAYNALIEPIAAPTKEGYTFEGWGEYPAEMPAHDVEIVGSYAINSYILSYFVDDEKVYEQEYEFRAEIPHREEPTKEGYTFSGWNDEPTIMPAHDVEVRGKFEVNSYKLIYNIEGASYITEKYEYGAVITPIENPTKEGYTFSGWTPEVPVTMPAHDVEVNAEFTVNQYTITYYANGESTAQTYDYHAVIIKPEDPTKEGHTFVGWDKEIPAIMPAEDLEVVAKFEINEYSVFYYVNEESEPRFTDKVKFDNVINYRLPIEKEGYSFTGWTGEEMPERMPAKDLYLYGVLDAIEYKLSYILDEKSYKEETYKTDARITPIENPSKDGHTFSGWEPEVPEIMPAHDLTVNGALVPNKHTLTFIAKKEDGELFDTAVYPNTEFGTILKSKEPEFVIPEGSGITWNYSGITTMPDNDLIINGLVAEKKEATDIYYGIIYNKDIDSLDADAIKALPNKYDGAATKIQEVIYTIPEDEEFNAICDLRDNAETEEEYAEYEAMADEYKANHLYAGLFIIPQSVKLDDILNELGKSVLATTPIVKTLTIDDTVYDIRVRSGEAWCLMEYLETIYKFTIKLK